jgi:hypothetical protein
VRKQEVHLISEHSSAFQINVLSVSRDKRYRDELHTRLTWRTPAFVIITAAARSHYVLPDIVALLTYRSNVIASKVAGHKSNTAIHADIRVATK